MHGPQGEITREVFWNILSPGSYTEQILLYILALTAFLLLGRALYKGRVRHTIEGDVQGNRHGERQA